MKSLILLLWSFISVANADLGHCPKSVLAHPDKAHAVEFLQSIAGTFQLGRCQIELNVCTGREDLGEDDSIVGDMLLTSANGDSVYLPLDFSLNSTARTYRVIVNGRRIVHYESIEHIPDRENGRTENYRLEFVKSDDLSHLQRVELGVYTSTVGGSRWFICE